jgi:hypothetical protein
MDSIDIKNYKITTWGSDWVATRLAGCMTKLNTEPKLHEGGSFEITVISPDLWEKLEYHIITS